MDFFDEVPTETLTGVKKETKPQETIFDKELADNARTLDRLLHSTSRSRSRSPYSWSDSYDRSYSRSRSRSRSPPPENWSKLISSSSSRSPSPQQSRKRRRTSYSSGSEDSDHKRRSKRRKSKKSDKEKRIDDQLKKMRDPFSSGIWDTGYDSLRRTSLIQLAGKHSSTISMTEETNLT